MRVAVTGRSVGPPLFESLEVLGRAPTLERLRAADDATLTSYGWVDRKSGIVRIPIDRAIDLLAARGLPSKPQAPQAPGGGAERKAEPGTLAERRESGVREGRSGPTSEPVLPSSRGREPAARSRGRGSR